MAGAWLRQSVSRPAIAPQGKEDNPACALQARLMIRIELYRETRIRTRLIPTAYSSFRVDIHFCRVRLPPPPSKRGLGGEANIER